MTGERAACAGVLEPLWDATVDGESERQKAARHAQALAYCAVCPVVDWCEAGIDPKHDDGVRGGRVLPTIHDSQRRSVWVGGFPPATEGRVLVAEHAGLAVCDRCFKEMSPQSLPRHRRRVHGLARAA